MIKYDSIFFLPFFLINRIKTYLSSFVLNKFFLKKNRLYIINHILFISKKIVKYIESMKKIVLKNFFLYAQILILNINKIEKHYNYCRIFFFFGKLHISANRISIYYCIKFIFNSKKIIDFLLSNFKSVDILFFQQQYLFFYEIRCIIIQIYSKKMTYYRYFYTKTNILTYKILKILIQKFTSKSILHFSSKKDFFNWLESDLKIYCKFLYHKKIIQNKFMRLSFKNFSLTFQIFNFFYFNKAFILSYMYTSKKPKLYINSIHYLYFLRFVIFVFLLNTSIPESLIKNFLSKILRFNGDINLYKTLKILNKIKFIIDLKLLKIFGILKVKIKERHNKHFLNSLNFLKNKCNLKKTFISETNIKNFCSLFQFFWFFNIIKIPIKMRLLLKIIKRLLISNYYIFVFNAFSLNFSILSLHKFYKNRLFCDFVKTNYFPAVVCLISSGFSSSKKNILYTLMNIYKKNKFYLWFLQENFLLETNRLKNKKKLDSLINNTFLRKFIFYNIYSSKTRLDWLNIVSNLSIGLFRLKFIKIVEMSNHIINTIKSHSLRIKELPFLHLFLTLTNLFDLNKNLFLIIRITRRFPVGFNISNIDQFQKKFCLYIKNLKSIYIIKKQILLFQKNIKHNYLIKRQKKISKKIQDCGDIDHQIKSVHNKLLEIYQKKKINTKFLFLNEEKKIFFSCKKIKYYCTLKTFINVFIKFFTFQIFNGQTNSLPGYCFLCILSLILLKKKKNHNSIYNNVIYRKKLLKKEFIFSVSDFFTKYKNSLDLFKKKKILKKFSKIFINFKKNLCLENPNFYKLILKYRFLNLVSNFIIFKSLLGLLSYNSSIKYYNNIWSKEKNFNFLYFYIFLFILSKDPTIEFIFHIEKQLIYVKKMKIIFFVIQYFKFKNFFFDLLDFLNSFKFNMCRFFFEKTIILKNLKKYNIKKKIKQIFLKKKLLNFSYLILFNFILFSENYLIKKRGLFSLKVYSIKFVNIKNEFFIYHLIISNSFLNISQIINIHKKIEKFFTMNLIFFYKEFIISNNSCVIKSFLFYNKKNILEKYFKSQTKKKLKQKFLSSSFCFFFSIIYNKNKSTFENTVFSICKYIINSNNNGDFQILFNFFLMNFFGWNHINFNIKNFDRMLVLLVILNNRIIKTTRLFFYRYSFFFKFLNFNMKKNLYAKKFKFFDANKFILSFIDKKIFICFRNILHIGYLANVYKELVDSGNVSKNKLINLLYYITICQFKKKNNCVYDDYKCFLEIFYFTFKFLSENLYLKWTQFVIDFFFNSIFLKEKILFILHRLFIQYRYMKILFLINNKIKSLYDYKKVHLSNFEKKLRKFFFKFQNTNNFIFYIQIFVGFDIISLVHLFIKEKIENFQNLFKGFFSIHFSNSVVKFYTKKTIFLLCLKLKKKTVIWFFKLINTYFSNNQFVLFNTNLFSNGLFLTKNLLFVEKVNLFKKLLSILYSNKKKEYQHSINNILKEYGYLIFYSSNIKYLLEILRFFNTYKKIHFLKLNTNLKITINGAFIWQISKIKLYQFSFDLILLILNKIKSNKIINKRFYERFKIQFIFINNVILTFLKKEKKTYYLPIIKKLFIVGIFLNPIFCHDFFNSFLEIILLYLNKKKYGVFKKMFTFFYSKLNLNKNFFLFNKTSQTVKILTVFYKIFLKSKKKFFKNHSIQIKNVSIIFFKLLNSNLTHFQAIGLKGIFILIKKNFYLDYLSNLAYYIIFIYLKSSCLYIKLICISIIITYISYYENLEFRQNLIQQIFLKYLNNKKSLFRFNSLVLFIKTLFNLKFYKRTQNLKKPVISIFFHFLFDSDFICRFFSGLIYRIIFSIISNRNRKIIFDRLFILCSYSKKTVQAKFYAFLDWNYIISTTKKHYDSIKFISFPNLYFLFNDKIDLKHIWVYFHIKLKAFFYFSNKHNTFLNFSSVFNILYFLILKSITKNFLIIKKELLNIFIFLSEHFFGKYIQNCIYIFKKISFGYFISVYEFIVEFKSILKNQIKILTIFWFEFAFLPSIDKNFNITNSFHFKQNLEIKISSNVFVKFLKKCDLLFVTISIFYVFFFKNLFISSNNWLEEYNVKKNLKNHLKKLDITFYKYLIKIRYNLINLMK